MLDETAQRGELMNREEFWAWLDTCPTHKWECVQIEGDYCRIIFPLDEEDDADED
jgi:hypothetical protein